jgi:hypothetical protein
MTDEGPSPASAFEIRQLKRRLLRIENALGDVIRRVQRLERRPSRDIGALLDELVYELGQEIASKGLSDAG